MFFSKISEKYIRRLQIYISPYTPRRHKSIFDWQKKYILAVSNFFFKYLIVCRRRYGSHIAEHAAFAVDFWNKSISNALQCIHLFTTIKKSRISKIILILEIWEEKDSLKIIVKKKCRSTGKYLNNGNFYILFCLCINHFCNNNSPFHKTLPNLVKKCTGSRYGFMKWVIIKSKRKFLIHIFTIIVVMFMLNILSYGFFSLNILQI